jgi:hypothetical protein
MFLDFDVWWSVHDVCEVFGDQVLSVIILHQANLDALSVNWDKLKNGISCAKTRE